MTSGRSMADCAGCATLPPKKNDEESTGTESPGGQPDFAEVRRLHAVLSLQHESEQYEASETRLLRCAECGTHYVYTRYEEEAHYPHNYGGRLARSLRRLDPTSAADLLERIAGSSTPSLPSPEARLVREFAERTPGQSSGPAVAAADEARRAAAAAELAALRAREAELWPALEQALTAPSGFVRDYAARSLLFRFAGDFERARTRLLEHPHPEVRFVAAELAVRIGYRDGAVFDVLETPAAVRSAFEGWVKKQATLEPLVTALAHAALAGRGTARRFEYAMLGTPSSWHETSLQHAAVGALALAADHGADLRTALLPLLALRALEPLQRSIEKSRAGAERLLALLEVVEAQGLSAGAAKDEVRDLLARCRARVARAPKRKR